MKRINPYEFYEFGLKLAALRRVSEENSLYLAHAPIYEALGAVQNLLAGEMIQITVSRHCAFELERALNQIYSRHYLMDDGSIDVGKDWNEAPLSPWDISGLRTKLQAFETVFLTEMRDTTTYFVPEIGIFRTPDLVAKADEHIPADLLKRISDEARTEIRDAGQCLAFSLSSAAGFHILRAVELVMRDYCRSFPDFDLARLGKSWGATISELYRLTRTDGSSVPDKKTVRNLDLLRDLDRNPTMHAEAVLSESEAQVLFGAGVTAITAMAAEMKTRESKEEPELPLPSPEPPALTIAEVLADDDGEDDVAADDAGEAAAE